MGITKPGKYKISFEEYLADPCPEPSLTRSVIKVLIDEPPRKAFLQHPRLSTQAKEEGAEKFDIGTAAHALFLEGEDIVRVIDAPDWRKNEAKDARDMARAEGKIPLLVAQYCDVLAMVTEAHRAFEAWDGRGLKISHGEAEATYVWQEENGIWCRCRPDWKAPETYVPMIAYKTTGQSADSLEYARIAIAHGHDIEDAFYRRGIKAAEGYDPQLVFMVQETEPPYLCAFMELDMMTRDMGEQKVAAGIAAWASNLETGKWPGYQSRTYTMEAPPWALAQWELRKFVMEADNV